MRTISARACARSWHVLARTCDRDQSPGRVPGFCRRRRRQLRVLSGWRTDVCLDAHAEIAILFANTQPVNRLCIVRPSPPTRGFSAGRCITITYQIFNLVVHQTYSANPSPPPIQPAGGTLPCVPLHNKRSLCNLILIGLRCEI